MRYRLVQLIDDDWIVTEADDSNVVATIEARGYAFTGLSRKGPSMVVREELQGQPQFTGLCGPMWDGDAVRYEDSNAYKTLSA